VRLLLAGSSAILILLLAAGGFIYLLDRYSRHHETSVTAVVTLDAAGQIRIDGQPIGFEVFRAAWEDQAFRAEHCGRWRFERLPGAPRGRGDAIAAIIECR